MKSFIVFALFVAASLAAPVEDKDAYVVRYENENTGTVEGYRYGVETSNGISLQEEGRFENVGLEEEAVVVRGEFAFRAPDGEVYRVVYEADKDGFRPQGAHLPQV